MLAARKAHRRRLLRGALGEEPQERPLQLPARTCGWARDLLGVSRNLSLGGIRFEAVGCEIDLDETLRVTFNVGDETVVAVGKVVWSTEVDPITTDVGLEFIEIDPEAARMIEDILADADVG